MLEQRYDGTQETLGTAAALTDLRSRLAEHERELHEAWAREAMLREALGAWVAWAHEETTQPGIDDAWALNVSGTRLRESRAALQATDTAPLEAIHAVLHALEEVRSFDCCCEDAGPGFVCAACHKYGDILHRVRRFFGEPRP